MNKFDKNFHINFSPMYLAVAVMIMFLVAFNLKADGNTTAHGIVLSDEEIAQAKKDLAPELVSMPYTVVDKATIVVGNYRANIKSIDSCPQELVIQPNYCALFYRTG